MTRVIATALVLGALGAAVAGCGDTRSNKELNGVATWPAGQPAHGAWNPGYPGYTYSYGGSDVTTTTTRTYPPAYYEPRPYEPPPYPPPAYPPPGGYR